MNTTRIADLLGPFVATALSETQLQDISMFIDILLRWNEKLNLTAIRDPEQMVLRHFGESIFTAQQVFGPGALALGSHVMDVGSGAGFPGIPIKLCFPTLRLTLIEAHYKKAVFLREVVRTLKLTDIDVFAGRAEQASADTADVVTLRAVDRFQEVLAVAARLVKSPGQLALLVGQAQCDKAATLLPSFRWGQSIPIPRSNSRILLIGSNVPPP